MPTDTIGEPPAARAPAVPSYEELARELIELEKPFPPPERAELLADAKWFEERWGKPEFEPYRGMCIAVLNGVIIGTGDDELQLRVDVARRLNVHPARLIIAYIPLRGQWSTHVHVSSDG